MSNENSTPTTESSLGLTELIAIGVGGMIGGGIFSVLGMAVGIAGRAAPFAFLVGSVVAAVAGYSYIKLALGFRSDGASFTYLERAFPKRPNIAGIAGWTVIIGYVGTLALYAFTFGAYGAHLLGGAGSPALRIGLSAAVLLFFMTVNLIGAKASGRTEDFVVYTKIFLLAVFVVAGARTASSENLTPVFETGITSPFVAGALIFVAFEGFQLITNAVVETRSPEVNVPRGIYGSIAITSLIYVGVAVVAIGNLDLESLTGAKEYALSVAAEPSLGSAGKFLVDIAALLATSSAINATLFGASRMLAEMATSKRVPQAFHHRNRAAVPWVAVVAMTTMAGAITFVSGLETIAAFSSLVFLLVSIAVSVANYRLRETTQSRTSIIAFGIVLMTTTVLFLIVHLWQHEARTLVWIAGLFASIVALEVLYFRRQT